jgi:hypothetical protein
MEKILVLAYPGTGKTYLAEHYANVIDFEQQHYVSLYDEDVRDLPLEQIKGMTNKRIPNPAWPANYITAIKAELEKNLLVITTFIPSTYEALRSEIFADTKIILAIFNPNNFEELVNRFKVRGNAPEFIDRRRADFPKVVELFNNDKEAFKIIIETYLDEALKENGISLVKGKGYKNYI